MRLAGSGVTDQQDVLPLLNVFTPHQLGDQHLVDRRLGLKVEGLRCES